MNTVQSAGKQSKKLAQDAAKKIAKEPLEVLKNVGPQVTGVETQKPAEDINVKGKETVTNKKFPSEAELVAKKEKLLAANRNELEAIKKQKTFEDLQEKIMNGEDVFLENYPDLPIEQKQVLKAQMEAISERNEKMEPEEQLFEPGTKRKRGVAFGMAGKIEKLKKKSEIRMGPGG